MTPTSGRVIAWLSFLLGIGVSIAGNIGHAASDGMQPGEWAGAAFWPLALMLTIEILTRVKWQPELRWIVARIAGLLAVAVVAAVLSYRHLAGLMTYWGEDWANAHLGPLAVDGLMLVAATALLSISHETKAAEPLVDDRLGDDGLTESERLSQIYEESSINHAAKQAGLPWDHPNADPVADLAAAKERYGKAYGVPVDEIQVRIPEKIAEAVAAEHGTNWDDESQSWVADPTYLDSLEPPQTEKTSKPAAESRLHVVSQVPMNVTEEAALQAWIDSGRNMSSSQVAEVMGVSKSTAHRRMSKWQQDRRIVR